MSELSQPLHVGREGETDREENKMGVKSLALFSALIPVPSCSFAFLNM